MMLRRTGRAMILAFVAGGMVGAVSCGGKGDSPAGVVTGAPAGLANCQGNAVLTRTPVALSALSDIVPLGNLNPPGHVFPTDHIYFYTPTGSGSSGASGASGATGVADVVSPGNITVVQVGQQTQSGGGQPTSVDYLMSFFPCADVLFYFYHLSTLSPDLLAQVGSFAGGCNAPYVIGSITYQQCYKTVSIRLSAGAPLGTMGGPGRGGFDMGGYDRRTATLGYVNPSRSIGGSGEFAHNKTICPLDYFTGDVAPSMRAMLGGRGMRRMMGPVCGEVMQDRAGTAQGRWFSGSAEQEEYHLGLVHDNIDPTLGAFSVGTMVPTLPVGVYTFTPVATGRMNADFSRVTPDGNVYCYQATGPSAQRVYVKLTDASTLMIGAVAGASCGDPSGWSAALAATQFKR